MIAVPMSRGALAGAPLMGLGVGAVTALLFSPWLGVEGAAAVGVAQGVPLGVAMGWMALRSRYGSLQGVVSAAALLLLVIGLGSGSVALAAVLSQVPTAAGPAAFAYALVVAGASGLQAYRVYRSLKAHHETDAWLRAAVDWRSGHVREVSGSARLAPKGGISMWWIAALAPNAVLLARGWGLDDARIANLAALAFTFVGMLFARRAIGPLLGRACYLREEEARRGLRLVHEDDGQLQSLRRGWWLTRWVAPHD